MRETCFQSLDWEDPLEKGKDYPLKYSGLENSMGLQKVRHDRVSFTGELWKRRTNHVWKQLFIYKWGFPGCTSGNTRDCVTRLPTHETKEMQLLSLGWEDLLEEGLATYSSILSWRILWTEEPGRLQSIGLQRVEHGWSDLACMHAWAHIRLCQSKAFRWNLSWSMWVRHGW